MIGFLRGAIEFKANNYILIDVGGVGYKVFMPAESIKNLEMNSSIKIFTYTRVSQDDISLFGFLTNEELMTFELLISVGGIGAKSAVNILSNIEPTEFAISVITDDVATLKKLPGIGPKTAQRIILELKDKIKTENAVIATETVVVKHKFNQNELDAMDALQVLGFNRKDIENIMEGYESTGKSVEDIIREQLVKLSK